MFTTNQTTTGCPCGKSEYFYNRFRTVFPRQPFGKWAKSSQQHWRYRAGHDVRFVTLGRRRQQLPHDPTLLLQSNSLGRSVLVVLLSKPVSERWGLSAGRGWICGQQKQRQDSTSLNPELIRIQKMLTALLVRISSLPRPAYLALDGHFGNHPAYHMVHQTRLRLNSKFRWVAALCFIYDDPYQGKGPHRKFGERVDYQSIPERYLKDTIMKDDIQTCTYQPQLLHSDFPEPLNMVIIVKTNLCPSLCTRYPVQQQSGPVRGGSDWLI